MVAALNHPPEVMDLYFTQDGEPASKFTESCKTLTVCRRRRIQIWIQ